MIIIKKLKLKNFKKFPEQTFDFNDDINIVVGDNESGKSSLLEAMEMCLNFSHRGRPLNPELIAELFNNECIAQYLAGDLSQTSLPEMLIEAYIEGNPSLRGKINTDGVDAEGMFVHIHFDSELIDSYTAFIADRSKVSTLPVELYRIDWFGFHWERITHHNKGVNCLFVDPARLHPSFGRSRYIDSIINAAIGKSARATLNLNYRQMKVRFNDERDVVSINEKLKAENDVSKKSLKITADIGPTTNWESNLQLAVDDVSFSQIGKGEQNQIQIKIAIQNRAKDVDVIMLEEPENHLSHINLVQLISYIEKRNQGKQIFITTHSSYVLNKLSVGKLCLLSNGYTRLKNIDKETIGKLKRLPGYDTLRVVLAQKLILVEGPSDELVLKKIYLNMHSHLPEEDGIDIIVVRGIGFKTYLDIAKAVGHPVHVVKDNDEDYQSKIVDWMRAYKDYPFIKCFSPSDNVQSSLEPALVETNGATEQSLDRLAKEILSDETYQKYASSADLAGRKQYLKAWYKTGGGGTKKVDSAIRIFDGSADITYPDYLTRAASFGA